MDMQDVPCEVVVAFHLIVVLSLQSVIDNLRADNLQFNKFTLAHLLIVITWGLWFYQNASISYSQ